MRAPLLWTFGLGLLLAGASWGACGPRESREPTQPRAALNQDPLQRCQARDRCYRAIIVLQLAAVRTVRLTLSKADPERVAKLSGQLRRLVQPASPQTPAACRTARTRMLQAISLLKAEYTHLVRQALVPIARQLRDPDERVRQTARVSLGSLKKEMRRIKRKLTGLEVCRPFARRK